MDTDSIQVTVQTPVEVEFKFFVKDLKGEKHPAIIRYHYPLFLNEYFTYRTETGFRASLAQRFRSED